jgi:hypothetical protein
LRDAAPLPWADFARASNVLVALLRCEEIMSIKHLLQMLYAITFVVCLAVIVKAYLELRQMDRAEKRRRKRESQGKPAEGTEEPIRRAG